MSSEDDCANSPCYRKALIIEDDKQTAKFVAQGLRPEGFGVTIAHNGRDGLNRIETNRYDVAIVDIKLPDISGFELIRIIRDRNVGTPIIVLSSMNTPADKIAGLNCGADDYLGKPFARDELLARISALLRRTTEACDSNVLRFRNLELRTSTREVRRGGRAVVLTSGEYDLLALLMKNAGKTLSFSRIVTSTWGSDYMPSSAVVETRVYSLRKKLCANGEPNIIFTVRGFGYVLR